MTGAEYNKKKYRSAPRKSHSLGSTDWMDMVGDGSQDLNFNLGTGTATTGGMVLTSTSNNPSSSYTLSSALSMK